MHPYSDLPDQHFWKRFVSNSPWRDLPLGGAAKFRLNGQSRIAAAGSCFAQHIARYLNKAGHGTYIAETAHPLHAQFGGEIDSYKLFSARYGNIYTARQCLETFKQAFGLAPMVEDFAEQDGRVYDLLRPNAVPEGFADLREAREDRIHHLACVRKMFQTTDIFIFTLGLTECWYNAEQGHSYPVCPGTARGVYDPLVHKFRNFSYPEVAADLEGLIIGLREVNPGLSIILTVSPVPLVATYTNNDVLVASSYSKSVLRAVCGEIDSRYNHVQYFPSYEIVSHAASFGQYLASDLREVTERGVSHVMARFFATFFDAVEGNEQVPAREQAEPQVQENVAGLFEVECEEIFNDVRR